MNRYVIVGTGVTGVTALNTLRMMEPSAEISMVGDDPHGFYSRPGIAYYLNGEIPEKQLPIFSRKDWKMLNVRYFKGVATRLDLQKHLLEIGSSGMLKYDRLLIATGSTAVPLTIPGADLKGVVKLDDFEDTRRIISLARHAKSAVVVGGGIIAVELVEGLIARGLKVHFFLRGDRYWPNVLDEKESHLLERRLVEDGVILHYQTEAAEVLGKRGKVVGVRTTKGETIRCQVVAVGIGVKPRIELAKAAGLATERGILTDETLQTSNPDVFAGGDVSQVHDPQSGKSIVDTLWHPALDKGKIAAINMTGKRSAYIRNVTTNILRLAGVLTIIIGAVGSGVDEDLVSVARGSSETWHELPNTISLESNGDVNHVRLMIGEKNLVGALVMGDQKLSEPIQEIISLKVDITPIRNQLKPGAPLGQIIMDFWSASNTSRGSA
jgi:NADPH-dependent 2,4-dienoyl-CoA reductase/sulfur reductase-like enzyme